MQIICNDTQFINFNELAGLWESLVCRLCRPLFCFCFSFRKIHLRASVQVQITERGNVATSYNLNEARRPRRESMSRVVLVDRLLREDCLPPEDWPVSASLAKWRIEQKLRPICEVESEVERDRRIRDLYRRCS